MNSLEIAKMVEGLVWIGVDDDVVSMMVRLAINEACNDLYQD